MAEQLKQCPFCGSSARIAKATSVTFTHFYIRCENKACWSMTGACSSEEDAISIWNNRHTPEGMVLVPIRATQEMIDAVRSEDYTWSIEGMYSIMVKAFMEKQ